MLRHGVKLQYTLEDALHVSWLPWRIRYTSSTTSASALYVSNYLLKFVRLIKASDITVVVSDIVIGTLPCA